MRSRIHDEPVGRTMKKISVLTVAIVVAAISVSFAAENENWMQKMKDKFQKKEIAIDNKTAPVKEINKNVPVKEAQKIEAPKKLKGLK